MSLILLTFAGKFPHTRFNVCGNLDIMDVNDFKIKWWQWVLYIAVSAGLLYITKSWLMSLGIMLLLILLDRWLAEYERKKRGGDDDDILF